MFTCSEYSTATSHFHLSFGYVRRCIAEVPHRLLRYGNPTTRVVEEKLRELEGAEDCLVSSSGMNSATTMLLALVPAGGHIITTTDCYRRTRQFIQTVLPKMGVTATVLDPSDMGALEKALEEHDNTSVYFSESPTNPYLR